MNLQKHLFFSVSFLICVGIIFCFSLSAYTVLYYGYDGFHFFIRQLLVGVVGITIMWGLSQFDPDKYLVKLGLLIFFSSIFLMSIMHFLPDSMVTSAGGAKRWIRLPGFSLAPVEFFKIGFVYFLAWSFERKISSKVVSVKEEIKILLPYLGVFLIVVYLIAIMQNDLGQIVVLALTFAIMALFSGTSIKLFSILTSSITAIAFIFILTSEHRILRVKSWWSNIQDMVLSIFPDTLAASLRVSDLVEPYQISHSLNAINHGGLFGTGIGNGFFKMGFLSEVHTDFVLAGMLEEIGLIAMIIVTMVMFYVVYLLLKISNRSKNRVYYLFSFGVSLLISFSFLMNAYGITSITPIKGIAVPFLSYGGSSLLAICVGIGMVLMFAKKENLSNPNALKDND